MNSQMLKRRALFERVSESRDKNGQLVKSWLPILSPYGSDARVWASIMPSASNTRVDGESTVTKRTHTVAIRYRDDLYQAVSAHQWRVTIAGRIYLITSAKDHKDQRAFIIFDVEESITNV